MGRALGAVPKSVLSWSSKPRWRTIRVNRRRAGSSSQMPSQLDHAARGSDVLPWGCWKLGAGHGKAKCD